MSDENKKPDDEELKRLKRAWKSYNHTMDQIDDLANSSSMEATDEITKLMAERFHKDVEAINTPPKGKGGGKSR